MNAFTVLSTGHTSAYPCRYARRLLLVPSCPLRACGWLPARRLTSGESRQRVTPFRVSILRDRRAVLYAGSRLGECHVSAWQHGLRPIPFGPAIQPLGRVCMTTPQPHLYSSLPIVTCSTGRFVRLDAYRLSFPLSTVDDQSLAEGRRCLPFTGEVRVDDSPCWEYPLTHMDTQLSKITRPLPLNPRALRHGFERTGRTPWLQPTAYTRREQWYLAGVSPFVGWRAWPVTSGG